jgi:hypothetical protein
MAATETPARLKKRWSACHSFRMSEDAVPVPQWDVADRMRKALRVADVGAAYDRNGAMAAVAALPWPVSPS